MVLPMTIQAAVRWLMRRPNRWAHLRRVPMRQLAVMMTAVFLLFSVIGFYVDLMAGGRLPYGTTLLFAAFAGLNSMVWVLVLARLPMIWILALIVAELFNGRMNQFLGSWIDNTFHPQPVAPETGLHFAATAVLVVVMTSYFFFTKYMGMTGKETFRLQTELELAHSIQKTLVPEVSRSTRCFEIFGVSHPSDRVGGDLVDAVELQGGDTVAYLADIAGHGLQAGILMGMLKTAARTALTDGDHSSEGREDGGAALSILMQTLNRVLPQVKEAHMYATFTALRLNLNGLSFYGMAASTPLLHWSASRRSVLRIEERQFPLGLLPVSEFPSSELAMEPGDVVLIATDGILEVTSEAKSERDVEFGIEALEKLLTRQAELSLPELAASILSEVRRYGKQLDDQTLLLVRRRLN
jgi:serine phosphatase RsbU (regulator of sigma subunit)